MSKMPPVDDVAALEGAEKAKKSQWHAKEFRIIASMCAKTETSHATVNATGGNKCVLIRFVKTNKEITQEQDPMIHHASRRMGVRMRVRS